MKFRTLLLCAALAAGGACQRDDANTRAGEAAQNLVDKTKDVKSTAEKNAQEVTHANADYTRAVSDYAAKRDEAVAGYRIELKVYQASIPVAQSIATDPALTQADLDNANVKIGDFQRECDLAEQTIDALATSTSAQWDQADSSAKDQMQKVRDAHEDAFGALSVERKLSTTTDKVPVNETSGKAKVLPEPLPVPAPARDYK